MFAEADGSISGCSQSVILMEKCRTYSFESEFSWGLHTTLNLSVRGREKVKNDRKESESLPLRKDVLYMKYCIIEACI